MIQTCCQITHRQIRWGNCPWCNSPLPEDRADRSPYSNIFETAWWDAARILVDLDNKACETARLITAANLADHLESFEEALPALHLAVNDPHEEVQELGEQAFVRLAGSVEIEKITQYEEELSRDSDNLATLRAVLTLYSANRSKSDDLVISRQQLILQIIATSPGSKLAAPPLGMIDPFFDNEVLYQAKQLWVKQVDSQSCNISVLSNAADNLKSHDPSRSEEWLRRCMILEPENSAWPWKLGNIHKWMGWNQSQRKKQRQTLESETDWLTVSLSEFEKALELATDHPKWFNLALPSAAKAAFDAGEIHKAQHYAEELVARGSRPFELRTNQNKLIHGAFIHQGLLLLGRIAMVNGEIEAAKRHLMLSVTPPASHSLILIPPCGPNASLAHDLLQIGERDGVIQFLQQCVPLWLTGQDKLAWWISEIQKGKSPKFGANLLF